MGIYTVIGRFVTVYILLFSKTTAAADAVFPMQGGMGIQKRALDNAANTTAASRFSTKGYMGGQTLTNIPFDEFPKTRNIAVDVAPWLFIAHMRHCFDSSALSASVAKLKRAVLVPEVWAAVLVARASFITIPYEVAAAMAGGVVGSTRVALLFDNDYSVPGSGRKYLEHLYRDLHKSSKETAPAGAADDDDDGGDEAASVASAEEAAADDVSAAGDDLDDCVPSSVVAAASVATVVEVDWEAFQRYSNTLGAATPAFVHGETSPQPSKRGQRYEFYAAVLACLESGAIPPLVGELYVDDGRDDCCRRLVSPEPTVAFGRQIYAHVCHAAAVPPFRPAHLTATLTPAPVGSPHVRLNCYGIALALQKQRDALTAVLTPLLGQGILTTDRCKEILAANLRHVALMFRAALGDGLCNNLADDALRNGLSWTLDQAAAANVLCEIVPRGAPRCAEGERLALVFLRRWATDSGSGRSVFMCEDSDGPMLALQLLSCQICEQHNAAIEAPSTQRESIAVMRYWHGKYEELDYAFMAQKIAMRIEAALTAGLQLFAARRAATEQEPATPEQIWRRSTELVGMLAAMLFFVGSDYVQDVHRLVPDFPAGLHPTRLTRAVERTICMVAEAVGPAVLRSDHPLYVSPRGPARAPLVPKTGDGRCGLSPVMCALVAAVMLAEDQVHGTRFRCGDKHNGIVRRKNGPVTGRRRRRPNAMDPGSLTLCRHEMRVARRLFPVLVGCKPQDCGLQPLAARPSKQLTLSSKPANQDAAATEEEGRQPCLDARALIYACPYAYPLIPPTPAEEAAQIGGKRKRDQSGSGAPSAKRPKRAPAPMRSLTVSASKFALHRKFAAAVGDIPGCGETVKRFADAGLHTGKRPAKKRLDKLSAQDRLSVVGVIRGQLARLVCEDWLLHAYIQEGRVLDCTARAATGDSLYGYSLLKEEPQRAEGSASSEATVAEATEATKKYEKMGLEWPRRLIVDADSMACARACLRGYRDTGY